MKKIRCPICKTMFSPPNQGRRPRYCSAACRQRAYRKREADPHRKLKALVASDLYKIKDATARVRAAVKVLEEAGYEVILEQRSKPRTASKLHLRLIDDDEAGV